MTHEICPKQPRPVLDDDEINVEEAAGEVTKNGVEVFQPVLRVAAPRNDDTDL
jgi:hypothetical protein